LKRKRKNHNTNQIFYRADDSDCSNCVLRCKCIEPHRPGPRMITRFENNYYEKAKLWYCSFIGKKLYRLGKTVMENIFGGTKAFPNAIHALKDKLQNFIFAIFSRFVERLFLCWL